MVIYLFKLVMFQFATLNYQKDTLYSLHKKNLLRMGQHVKPWNHTNIYEQIYSFAEKGQPSLCLAAMIHHWRGKMYTKTHTYEPTKLT